MEKGLNYAIKLFLEADEKCIDLGVRCTVFYIYCLYNHHRRSMIMKHYVNCIKNLKTMDGYIERPIDIFRYAVLCYQIGTYQEGVESFRKLREIIRRSGGTVLRVKDFWRDANNPENPRPTIMRVTKRITRMESRRIC